MGSRAAPFSIVVAPDETISDLKAKVEFREGIPANKQTLFHRQKRLENDALTVRKAKFKGGDTVHIVLHKTDELISFNLRYMNLMKLKKILISSTIIILDKNDNARLKQLAKSLPALLRLLPHSHLINFSD